MPYKPGQEPLMDWLIDFPLEHITETRFLGGDYVRIYNYFLVLSFLYEAGAILGYSRRNKLGILEQVLEIPTVIPNYVYSPRFGHKSMQSLVDWQQAAEERLHRFENDIKKQPDTFKEFIFERELEIATGVNPTVALEACEQRKVKRELKEYKKKIKVEPENAPRGTRMPIKDEARMEIRSYVLEGIGFGSIFPQLTEMMSNNYWESVRTDRDRLSNELSQAREDGFLVPKLAILSFKQQEIAILRMVAYYAESYYPELLNPLGLKRYCLKQRSLDSPTPWGDYSHWFSLIRSIDYFGRC